MDINCLSTKTNLTITVIDIFSKRIAKYNKS